MTTTKNRPRNLMGALLIALVPVTALLAGCGRTEAPADNKPTPVRVQLASNGPAVPPIDTNGIVVTKHEMRLSFKMGGVVRRIYVQEGDVVKMGQRLAEIELTEVGGQVEQARQLADKAARDLKRGENLYADQVISLEQLQDLRTQAAMASAASTRRNAPTRRMDQPPIRKPDSTAKVTAKAPSSPSWGISSWRTGMPLSSRPNSPRLPAPPNAMQPLR